jgi:hypothetical protein
MITPIREIGDELLQGLRIAAGEDRHNMIVAFMPNHHPPLLILREEAHKRMALTVCSGPKNLDRFLGFLRG